VRLVRRRSAADSTPLIRRNFAVGFLVVYLALLLLLPSQLVFAPLGAPGKPATLWAIGGLVWWCCLTLGGLNRVGRTTPTRITTGLLAVAVLAAYANGTMSGWYAPLTTRQATDDVWTLMPPTVEQIAAASLSAADRGLLSMAGWLAVVLIAAEGLRSWRELEVLVSWITWLGAVVGAIGILQFATGFDLVRYVSVPGLSLNNELSGVLSRSVLRRVSSTAIHPIEFGVAMVCILPLALHRMIHEWGRRGALVPAGIILVSATLSVSRSAILALLVTLVVLFAGWPSAWRVRALLIAPLTIVALRLAVPGLVGTLISLFTNLRNDPSVSGRTSDYTVVLDLYADHPWLGRGLYTFLPRYYRILDNQWLTTLVELGAVGLATVLVFLLTAFLCARSGFRRAGTARSRHLSNAIASAVAAISVSMVTYDAWGFPMHTGLSFLMVGLSGAAWRLAHEDEHAARVRALSPPLGKPVTKPMEAVGANLRSTP
jgi:hypothetical protein